MAPNDENNDPLEVIALATAAAHRMLNAGALHSRLFTYLIQATLL